MGHCVRSNGIALLAGSAGQLSCIFFRLLSPYSELALSEFGPRWPIAMVLHHTTDVDAEGPGGHLGRHRPCLVGRLFRGCLERGPHPATDGRCTRALCWVAWTFRHARQD